jgi:predicted MFS family arabinose efflux permease
MAAALGLSKSAAGVIASANFMGYLVGALIAATRIIPGSRRRWLMVGLALSAVTTGWMGLVSSPASFVVLRFIGGVASAFGLVFSSALVLDHLAAAGRSALSAVHFGGVGLGIAASAVVVSALTAGGLGWRALWLASGGLALAGCVVVAALVPAATEPRRAMAPASPHSARLSALAIVYGLFGFGYVITATFLVTIVREAARLRPLEPIVWVVVGVAAVPSVAVWTSAGRRIGDGRAFALAAVLEAIGVVASVLWTTPVGIVVSAGLLGSTFMGLTALGLIQARRVPTSDPRRTVAIMTAAFGTGQMLGPVCAGVLFDVTGSFLLSSAAAGAALLVAAGLAVVSQRG